jgi:hypothetical protein
MSNPLKSLERVKGIEPSSSAWKSLAAADVSRSIPENQPRTVSLNVNGNFPVSERRTDREIRIARIVAARRQAQAARGEVTTETEKTPPPWGR